MDGHALPPASDNKGPALLGVGYALHTIALVVYSTRLWSRLRPKYALTAADYAISVAIIAKCTSIGLTTAAVANGFGRHAVYLSATASARIGIFTFLTFIFSTIASGFARISIACLLLQVTSKKRWRLALWSILGLQIVYILVYIVAQVVQCESTIAHRIGIKQSQCLTPSQVWSFTYVSISISLFSDLVCAIIPICLICSLTRSLVEKILTSCLLGSCLLASGICVAKVYFMATYDFTSPDGFYLMVDMFFCSRMEEATIIIAACAPLLKAPVERALKRLGVRGFDNPQRELNELDLDMVSKDSENGLESSANSQQGLGLNKSE
ncbi:hypothetical protein QBC47DRAFT_436573 [Echria macrotheca]|uniref:Rhodopsin domain-containing protein n=1 Tax=Echria macrotheca TaxID=438768 RepID=A0AAJ0BJE7_9PEZI|nr:hypothetical protein QBC47DRAFT_436573 [Echria macrotheca]